MVCFYCNAEMPDENGVCPQCGRQAPRREESATGAVDSSGSAETTAAGNYASSSNSEKSVLDSKTSESPVFEGTMSKNSEFENSARKSPSFEKPAENQPSDNMVDVSQRLIWRFSIYDLLDEFVQAIILLAIAGLIGFLLTYFKAEFMQKYSPWVWGALLTVPILYISYHFFKFLYHRVTQTYELCPDKLYCSDGLLVQKTNTLLLYSVRGMKLKQFMVQCLFGLGNILIYSPDITSNPLKISGIGDIARRFKILEAYRQQALHNRCFHSTNADLIDTNDQTYHWRYSAFDLIDETIWGVLITIGFVLLGKLIGSGDDWNKWTGTSFGWEIRYLVQFGIPVLYWLTLGYIYLRRSFLTSYHLSPTVLTKKSGLLFYTEEIFVLYYLKDIQQRQNLWQRLIGVGDVILYLDSMYDIKSDSSDSDNSSPGGADKKSGEVRERKIVMRGLKNHRDIFDQIIQYRQNELQKYSGGPT